MSTAKNYDAFLGNLYDRIRPNTSYQVEVEIIPGDSRTGEIMDCERRVLIYENRKKIEELVQFPLTFDSEKDIEDDKKDTKEYFFIRLQDYLTLRSQKLGVKNSIVIRTDDCFEIKGELYSGKYTPRKDLAARFRELAESL